MPTYICLNRAHQLTPLHAGSGRAPACRAVGVRIRHCRENQKKALLTTGAQRITNHCNPSAEVTSERGRVSQNPHKTLSFRPTRSAASGMEETAFAGSGSQSRDEVFTPATPLIFPPASASATQLP